MDIGTGAALIIMACTILIGCLWWIRNERQQEQVEYYASFEV